MSALSDVQQLMLAHEALARHPIYNMPLCYRIEGPLDVPALHRALRDTLARHPALRLRYTEADTVDPGRSAAAGRTVTVQPGVPVETVLADVIDRPFDLRHEPPVRYALILSGDTHWLALCAHHIAGDSWSLGLVAEDVSLAYRALRSGVRPPERPAPGDYRRYAAWEAAQPWDATWWSAYLSGLPVSCLPGGAEGVPRSAPLGRLRSLDLGLVGAHTRELRRRAAARRISVPAALASWIAATCRDLGSPDEVVLGVPTVVRPSLELQGTVGPLLNTVPVRVSAAGPAADLTRTAEHAVVPPSRIYAAARRSAPDRSGLHLIAQVLNIEAEAPRLRLAGARVTPVRRDARWAVYPLVWDFDVPVVGNIRGTLRLAENLFTVEEGERVATAFRAQARTLEAAAA